MFRSTAMVVDGTEKVEYSEERRLAEDTKEMSWDENQLCGEGPTQEGGKFLKLEKGDLVRRQPVQRKGEKKTFMCTLCNLVLSSVDTMLSHRQGAKHMRKVVTKREELEEMVDRGEVDPQELGAERIWIQPIANPESSKRKVPLRLHERIRASSDPVVGLDWVTEYLTESDPEMEPQYECTLCGNKGPSNGIFTHLMGGAHRRAFVGEPHASSLSREELLRRIATHNESDGRLSERIKTVRSDVLYPWPAGKAPWSEERGGTGVPPTASVRVEAAGQATRLPALGTVPRPGSTKEAKEMMAVGRRMLELALEFGQQQGLVGGREREVILGAVCGRSAGLGGQKI